MVKETLIDALRQFVKESDKFKDKQAYLYFVNLSVTSSWFLLLDSLSFLPLILSFGW